MSADSRIRVRAVAPLEANARPPEGSPGTEIECLSYECRARNNAILLINKALEETGIADEDDIRELIQESAFAACHHRVPTYEDGPDVWDPQGAICWEQTDAEICAEDFIIGLVEAGWLERGTLGGRTWVVLVDDEPIARAESGPPSLEDKLSRADSMGANVARTPTPRKRAQ